ncbi:MAG TPA: diguanylate cyclase [Candidatus Limnocylindrales bacterium]|nr:diguanylate cyclase [Candidatus Limnocylindrales bacterium]
MRLLGVLALAAPVAIGILLIAMPDALLAWVDEGIRSVVAAVVAAAIGVSLTAILVATHFRYRLSELVKATERIAAGDYSARVAPHGGGLESRLGHAVNDIAAALVDTHDRATFDRLTGVANRQSLLAALFAEVERAGRYERPLSVAFVDIDHFKTVNDTYGHGVGDIVLRGVAQTIAANLRASDMIGRYGGEEFMLILTETGVEEGATLTEKLRTLVQRQRFAVDGGADISVTISIGIAGGSGAQLRMDTLVRDADAAMYSAKSLGRNQTYIFAEPDDDARVPRAPISAAGRARAVEIGQRARDAATAALTAVLSPLPHYRGQPSALIASIVVEIARQLQLPESDIDRLRVAALLHDVGKVAIPEEILEKPSALTSAEWRTVVQHPRIGQVILEQAAALKDAVPIILHHHERFAGHGYPYGLRANEIPLGARIVAIADAYDAMIHDRPYKRAISHEQAIAELRRHAGTQFDPDLVELFCDLYADRAPQPDLALAALHGVGGDSHPSPIIVPDPDRSPRRRRRSEVAGPIEPASSDSRTMAADGSLGLAPTPESSRPKRRRAAGPSAIAGDGSLSSARSRGGRADSAAS